MSRLGALHLTKPTGSKHTATVIFFHGSGATGEHMKEWVQVISKTFSFPHIKVMYPTAPLQPYTPADGAMSNVWFDRSGIAFTAPDKLESVAEAEIDVKYLIQKENSAGIPTNRIIVGGFSMGGALSFHTAYRWERNVAGVFTFSSFLSDKSIIYKELKENPSAKFPPLLQLHGDSDCLVHLKWGKATFNELKNAGVHGQFHILEKLGHSINQRGMELIKDFVEKLLPDV